ncbi:unnamed protein product [Echinostoma caproni]|uniref:ribose-5-phosphate isomerase n=1 Tax=Echinostoma caproni TaxID=27848 RepID=A0A183AQE5_9TREM|nr:unnamed protein product [Echinostoma caproni]
MTSSIETAKKRACELAVNEWLKDGQVIGVGSGTTIEYAVKAIGEYTFLDTQCIIAANKVAQEKLNIKCVPTSFQLDVAFDGADEICEDFTLIKGGGGCLLQEKIVASCASNFIVLADERKCSKKLGTHWSKGLPIEVIPMAFRPVQSRIEKLFGGKAVLRPAISKMGPQLTDNGNFLIDWHFDPNLDYDWPKVEIELLRIPGIVETGLFIRMARKVYIGNLDGSTKSWSASV